MNILYIAHRIPYPPNKGDKLRAFRQLQHLAQRHRVWCACFIDTPSDRQYVEPLSRLCEAVAAIPLARPGGLLRGMLGMLRGRTVAESFYEHRGMKRILREWCAAHAFDAVVAFSSSMAPYALRVPARRRILDLCDLDSRKWLDYAASARVPSRILFGIEGRRLAHREREWLESFDATLLITEAEARSLAECRDRGNLQIIGNGVDVPPLGVSRRSTDQASTVGFVGVMDYLPNVDAVRWFVSECWPVIRSAVPSAVFRVVGRSPVPAVKDLDRVPGVDVIGEVDDAIAEVARFDVSVAPMRIARGLQNKVLEAMACAKPVVLTKGAAEGIDGRHGHEFLVADSPAETADHVVRLLGDATERERIGLTARQFVAANHCWRAELDKFELIVTGELERNAPKAGVLGEVVRHDLLSSPVVSIPVRLPASAEAGSDVG